MNIIFHELNPILISGMMLKTLSKDESVIKYRKLNSYMNKLNFVKSRWCVGFGIKYGV